jgi:hypothetical protein
MTLYSAAALGEPQGGTPLGNRLSYQAKFDFQFGPKADPPKVVSAINQILPVRCWSDQLDDVELYGVNDQKIELSNFPTKKEDADHIVSLTLANNPDHRHI